MAQPLNEATEVANCSGRRRGQRKRERIGPVSLHDAAQGSGGLVQRRVPGDRLPSRIGIAFRAGSAQRPSQPFRMVDEFRAGTAFGAERPAGGVAGIGLLTRKAAMTTAIAPHRAMQSAD